MTSGICIAACSGVTDGTRTNGARTQHARVGYLTLVTVRIQPCLSAEGLSENYDWLHKSIAH